MAVTWKGKGNLKKKALERLERDMEYAAGEAASAFEDVVQGADRVETGSMNAMPVVFEAHETPKTIRASWGWTLADRKAHSERMTQTRGNYISYPDLQDRGFRHFSAGWIEGMMASVISRDVFREAMRRRGW